MQRYISIGTSVDITDVAEDESLRNTFAQNVKQFCIDNNFDGIDLDWEGIDNGTDGDNYGLLLMALRQAINGTELGLIATVGSGDYWMQWISDASLQQADHLQIMIYDKTGTWDTSPHGNHSSYEHFLEAYAYWVTDRGWSPNQLAFGMPFYGYRFDSTEGGLAEAVTYEQIVTRFPDLDSSINETNDSSGYYVFNGPDLIQQKTAYAVSQGLKGIFVWEMAQDALGSNSLHQKILSQLDDSCP